MLVVRRPMIYYVDVDDTLVRTIGAKRIPIPKTVAWVKTAHAAGNVLYLWSRGGASYAQATAAELGIESLFRAFLDKPDALIDDQDIGDWTHLRQSHPSEL